MGDKGLCGGDSGLCGGDCGLCGMVGGVCVCACELVVRVEYFCSGDLGGMGGLNFDVVGCVCACVDVSVGV